MRISVKVKACAKQEKIEKTGDADFNVWVRAQAKEGKANQELVAQLSRYFSVPKSRITILKGHTSKNKLIDIS